MATTVRVQYSIGTTWLLAGIVTDSGTVCIPPQPSGTTVCFRSRTETTGYRPSAWTEPTCIVVAGSSPVLYSLSIRIAEDGTPTVLWSKNLLALGVRLEFDIHDPEVDPTYGAPIDVDAAPGEYEFTGQTVNEGERISVRATPYTGFSMGAVSGTAGTSRTAYKDMTEPPIS